MEFDYKRFSDTIKSKMKYKQTLKDLSCLTGVSVPTLSRVFNSKPCSVDVILKICAWMQCKVDDFIIK